jgi:hypothetical protein
MNSFMTNSSSPRDHRDAIGRTYRYAEAAAITFFSRDVEFSVRHGAGAESADVHACPAIVTFPSLRALDESATVTTLLPIQEVAAAVVATEADPLGDGPIVPAAEGTGDEGAPAGRLEDTLGVLAPYLTYPL